MSHQWFYAKSGQQLGPVSSEQLKQLADSGQLLPSDLVWKDGMGQWVEARKVKGLCPAQPISSPQGPQNFPQPEATPPQWFFSNAGQQRGPVSAEQLKQLAIFVAKDGKQTGPFSETQVRSMLSGGFLAPDDLCWQEGLPGWLPVSQILGAVTVLPQPLTHISSQPNAPSTHGGEHPGFWLRFAALFIDETILSVACYVLGTAAASGGTDQDFLAVTGLITNFIASWLYYALMESSPKQSTLGKMACGFIVTDLQGHRISFGQASGRYFGWFVSLLILGIGFLMCIWTERKQCLHDMMSGCLMFKK